jgi:hypothetical protein
MLEVHVDDQEEEEGGSFVPILNYKEAAIARAKAAKNCQSKRSTRLLR